MQKKDRKRRSSTGKQGPARRVRKRRARKAGGGEPTDETSEIPMGYNVDTIVIMPVNMSTSFIYWEVTEGLLSGKRRGLRGGPSQLTLKVFETNRKRELYSFPVKERIGKHYIKCRASFNPLIAEIGMLRGKQYTGLLRSTPMNICSSLENATRDEMWMKKVKNSHAIISVTDRESAKKRTRLHSLIMHYYHTAGSVQYNPLSSGIVAKTPSSEE